MSNSITSIYNNAFTDCTELKEVIFSQNLISVSSECFKNYTSLDNVYIVGDIKYKFSIGNNAFENCTSLKTIYIENLRGLDTNAFKGCTALEKIFIEKGALMAGDVFADCENLEIYCEAEEKPERWWEGWDSDRPVHWGVTREEYEKLP